MHSYVYYVIMIGQASSRKPQSAKRNLTPDETAHYILTTVSVAVVPGKAAMAALRRTAAEDSFMMIVGVDWQCC